MQSQGSALISSYLTEYIAHNRTHSCRQFHTFPLIDTWWRQCGRKHISVQANPSVLTLPVVHLPEAPPLELRKFFGWVPAPIKASDHPSRTVTSCPASVLPPVDTNTRFGSGEGDLSRLPQMKEGSRIIFWLSCPYLYLAVVCFKLHGRTPSQRPVWRRRVRQNNENEERAAVQTLQRLCHAVLSCCFKSLK